MIAVGFGRYEFRLSAGRVTLGVNELVILYCLVVVRRLPFDLASGLKERVFAKGNSRSKTSCTIWSSAALLFTALALFPLTNQAPTENILKRRHADSMANSDIRSCHLLQRLRVDHRHPQWLRPFMAAQAVETAVSSALQVFILGENTRWPAIE